MEVHASVSAPCAADVLFAHVDDLAHYPRWLDLVHRAEPEAGSDHVWLVELRAKVGPLARSKRLRMVRTEHDLVAHSVRFERDQADGRQHAPWVLTARVGHEDGDRESTLYMHLHYGGSLWTGGVLERVLADQITRGRERLRSLVLPTP